jgi:vancomycin resistance protein YoaR
MKKSKHKQKNSKQKTNKILAILTLCTLGVTTIILGQFVVLDYNTNKILQDGTVINGLNLSGLSKEEASVVLINDFQEKADDFTLNIKNADQTWTLEKDDFVVNSDIHTILDMSQDKNTLLNTKEEEITLLSQFEKMGGSINVAFNYIFLGLDEKIDNIISQVETPPTNSTITFNPNNKEMFEICNHINGKRVDKNALYKDINEQFLISNNINVELKFIEEVATITKEYNENLTKKISSFSTNVSDSTGGRKHNVKMALEKFNGLVINPNEEISFNSITGPHTSENGYKSAIVIYNGEFTDGIGGGICQASTTLYNALLTSGVQINEVHKHTLPIRYVPLALDAMVSEYTADLKFVNTTDYPMFIKTYSDSESVTVEVYSHEQEYTYKTRSETLETISSNGDKIVPDEDRKYSNKVLFKGEYFRLSYPKDGYIAKSYLQKFKDGVMIEEQELRTEIYKAQMGVVIEGVEDLPEGVNPIDNGVKIYTPPQDN